MLVLTPQSLEVDLGLFIRPFQREAWVLVAAGSAIIIIMMLISNALINNYEKTDGYLITAFTAWIFVVLVNAYYGGAMTMFFSSEPTVPFNTIEDVMRY